MTVTPVLFSRFAGGLVWRRMRIDVGHLFDAHGRISRGHAAAFHSLILGRILHIFREDLERAAHIGYQGFPFLFQLKEQGRRVVFDNETDILAALDNDADIAAALSSLDFRPNVPEPTLKLELYLRPTAHA